MSLSSSAKVSRLKEPSTYAGLSGMFAGLASLPFPVVQPYFTFGAAFFGSIAVLMRETANKSIL